MDGRFLEGDLVGVRTRSILGLESVALGSLVEVINGRR